MASRALAFSDPEVIRLASTEFVPIADNCSLLQSQQDAEGDFFRLVAEQGHYGGRTLPSATRQGQYACTADGRLLASINTREPAPMVNMMEEALRRFRALSSPTAPASPAADPVSDSPVAPDPRYVRRPPEGGLVLRVFTRDLPRGAAASPAATQPAAAGAQAKPDWRPTAVNHDHVWLTADEAASLIPDPATPGTTRPVPETLARRLARFHMIDIVRGETPMWHRDQVRHAEMTTTVEEVTPTATRIRLEGRFRCETEGTWAIRPFGPKLEGLRRGYDARLLGHATWDPAARRFTAFEALAVGERWGGSEHNLRWDDLDPAPMAVLFDLADGTAPGDVTPPQGFSWSDYLRA